VEGVGRPRATFPTRICARRCGARVHDAPRECRASARNRAMCPARRVVLATHPRARPERPHGLIGMNTCLWMSRTRAGTTTFARWVVECACARSVVARFSADMEVMTGAQLHDGWLKTLVLCSHTCSTIKHVDLYMGSLASLVHPSPRRSDNACAPRQSTDGAHHVGSSAARNFGST
jgi:hypothetical protein